MRGARWAAVGCIRVLGLAMRSAASAQLAVCADLIAGQPRKCAPAPPHPPTPPPPRTNRHRHHQRTTHPRPRSCRCGPPTPRRIQMLDMVRYLVVWNPIIFLGLHFIFHWVSTACPALGGT